MSELKMTDLGPALEHHGVKGMKWGKRKTPQQQLNKLSGERIVAGATLKGAALSKMHKKAVKADPTHTYGKLSKEEKAAWDKKASGKTKRQIVALGVTETAVILGGGVVLIKAARLSPSVAKGAALSTVILAGASGKVRYDELRAVKEFDKSEQLREQIKNGS